MLSELGAGRVRAEVLPAVDVAVVVHRGPDETMAQPDLFAVPSVNASCPAQSLGLVAIEAPRDNKRFARRGSRPRDSVSWGPHT
jgi:hypothetical protein